MDNHFNAEVARVLLVEDNLADVRLVREALKESRIFVDLKVARDGVEALSFLRKEGQNKNERTPDLILLDLNLPRKKRWRSSCRTESR